MSRRSLHKQIHPLDIVYKELEETRFPITTSRKNISEEGVQAFTLGDVNYRGQEAVNFKTRGPSRYNKKFKSLYLALRRLIKWYDPTFKYTTIQVNKNVFCNPHVDKNNVGPSYGLAIGDFIGGNLVVEGTPYNIHDRFLQFDGTKGHWITPFQGTRYSIIWFTHTFKPPNPNLRDLVVTHEGLFKNGEMIKSYV